MIFRWDPVHLAKMYDRTKDIADPAAVVADFHRFWYDTERHATVTWGGHECWKMPTDMLIYAEMIHELRPATIIECGTYRGGSTLFFANLLDINGAGNVVSVDIWDNDDIGPDPRGNLRPVHPRITYVKGSSVAPAVVDQVRGLIEPGPTFVILDSDHTADHVRAELDIYAPLASVLVVEDTNLGHEVLPAWGPGPREAVDDWLPEHPEWFADRTMERLLLTCAPNGFLRRR